MTIAAGFRARDGVLICADTEYSGIVIAIQDEKLFAVEASAGKAVFSFCGHREFGLAAVQKCIQKIEAAKPESIKGHADIARLIEGEIAREYRKHVLPKPDVDAGSIYQLLVAIWSNADEGAALYSSWQGAIRRCDRYECIGMGKYVGDVLIGAMFYSYMDLQYARVVAAYALMTAKQHVDGVGGRTTMYSLGNDGKAERIPWVTVRPFEDEFKVFDLNVHELAFSLILHEDERFNKSLNDFTAAIQAIRRRLKIDDFSHAEAIAEGDKILAGFREYEARRQALQSTIVDPKPPQPSQEKP